jgi:membrane protein required for colicin V production
MILDIVYCLVLLLAFIRGYKKGLLHAIVTLLAILIGIMTAVRFSEIAAVYFDKWFNITSKYLPLIAFVAVFFAVYFLFRLVEAGMEGFFTLLKINFINKFLGGAVWALTWTMIFSTALFYADNMQLLSEEVKAESITFEKIEPLAPDVIAGIGKVIPPVKNIFNSLQEWFDDLEKKKTVLPA